MAVKIRLSRHGSKKNPYYRVVVSDVRTKRDGRNIEEVGRYNPMVEPPFIQLDLEKIDQWIANGAKPTDTVARLIRDARNPEQVQPKAKKPSKKAAAKAAAEAEKAAEAEQAE